MEEPLWRSHFRASPPSAQEGRLIPLTTTTLAVSEIRANAQPVTSSTISTRGPSKLPRIVYFSSVTENTKHLVDRLPFQAERIPLRRNDPFLRVTEPYVLFVPSYGGGEEDSAVPKQVIKFLNERSNRELCLGVVAAGNMNFGEHYCIAGKIIEEKLSVPLFYRFELRGMPGDVERIEEGLQEVFDRRAAGKLQTAGERSKLQLLGA